jgi:hypothetical protein
MCQFASCPDSTLQKAHRKGHLGKKVLIQALSLPNYVW